MSLRYTVFILLVVGVFVCCNDKEPFIIDRGEEYFPLMPGRILEYRVDSIIFDDGGSGNVLDTVSGYVREIVLDAEVDLEGDTVYRIQREHRRELDLPWNVTHVWTASNNSDEAERVEENQRIVKMVFPLYYRLLEDKEDEDSIRRTEWNPTKYINTLILVPVGTEDINLFSVWEGAVQSIHQPEQVGQFAFDSVMTCIQADDDNDLERRYVIEKYAKDIGLVFRMDTIIDSRCERIGDFTPCLGMNWMQKGEKGYIMRMELINHN